MKRKGSSRGRVSQKKWVMGRWDSEDEKEKIEIGITKNIAYLTESVSRPIFAEIADDDSNILFLQRSEAERWQRRPDKDDVLASV
jgi:hypothetical protein